MNNQSALRVHLDTVSKKVDELPAVPTWKKAEAAEKILDDVMLLIGELVDVVDGLQDRAA